MPYPPDCEQALQRQAKSLLGAHAHLRHCQLKSNNLFSEHSVVYFSFNLCVVIKQLLLQTVDQSVFAFN